MDSHNTQGYTDALAYVERAAVLAKNESWASMLTLANECEPQYPFVAEWVRAQTYHLRRQFDAAIQCYERAVALDVASSEMRDWLARAWYGLARCYIESDRMQLAIAPLQRAVEIDPSVHDTWHDLGVARISVGQATGDVALIKAAHEPLKRACDLDPTNIASWSALGGLYAMFNIQSGVEQVFQGLLRLNAPAAMQFRADVTSMLASRP